MLWLEQVEVPSQEDNVVKAITFWKAKWTSVGDLKGFPCHTCGVVVSAHSHQLIVAFQSAMLRTRQAMFGMFRKGCQD